MRMRNVLLPTDFSPCAHQAIPHAVFLATQFRARLELFHAIVFEGYLPEEGEDDLSILEDEIFSTMERAAWRRLNGLLSSFDFGDLEITKTQQRCISAAAAILEQADRSKPDLIIMGTHGRRGVSHLLLGSVTEEVVRRASCPVMTVRQQRQRSPLAATEKILVPVDFSDHSRRALLYAKHLAAHYQAKLQLLHVVQEPILPSFYSLEGEDPDGFGQDLEGRAQSEMLEQFASAGGPDLPFEAHVVKGRAGREILQFAEQKGSDMICIATHGLTGLDHFLIGSVAQKVVRRAPCPVFTVKAFGRSLVD